MHLTLRKQKQQEPETCSPAKPTLEGLGHRDLLWVMVTFHHAECSSLSHWTWSSSCLGQIWDTTRLP